METVASTESNAEVKAPPSRLYSLQVRAFLEAAEDVELDSDTLEDILDGFEDFELNIENQEDDPESVMNAEDTLETLSRELEEQDYAELSAGVESTWTSEESKRIIHYLKERGTAAFLKEYVAVQSIPVPRLLHAFGVFLCPELINKQPKSLLYFLKVVIYQVQVLQQRKKLPTLNTIDDAVDLIQKSRKILILTGAGISVSCGIPDFRSKEGLYASLKGRTEHELDDPQQMFDIQYFREKPSVFYNFAREIYPSNFVPSPCHRFIKLVEDKEKLLRNYTQNIDTLETQAGVKRVLQCHGSFATASCVQCHQKVDGKVIEKEILNREVPLCQSCLNVPPPDAGTKKSKSKKKKKSSGWQSDESESDEPDIPDYPPGIMKPDITFFGEKLTDDFESALLEDREQVDLIIIIGTSLKVSPVSEIISHLPHSVPQILINKTPIKHISPDIILLGNADDIILYLCGKLRWELPSDQPPSTESKKRSSDSLDTFEPERVAESHVWLFEGAEGGRWLKDFLRDEESTASGGKMPESPVIRDSKKPRFD